MATGKPWYETLFVRDYYDYFFVGGPRGIFPPEEYGRRTDEQVDFVARALELPEGARVLDLCCGHGRHAVRLAQRGYRVTGLDISAYHLRLAKAAARKAGVAIGWIRGDMREIPREAGRFDAVINMFTAFGYFDTEEENQRVLDGVARSLRKGGRFLIDTMNHDWLMRVFRDSDCSKRVDGSYVAEMRWYDIRTGRVIVEMLHFPPAGRPRRRWHSVRLYTYTELATMLSKAGLRVARSWGGFDGSELTMQSARLIVMAEKQ